MTEKPKIIDLFCGCGGFGLGAELAGFEAAVAVDIDSTLQSAYRLNFGSTDVVTGDVSELDRDFWKQKLGKKRIDGLIGGPPCQGFSRMGKKDKSDPRNSLVGHFYRHVKLLNPKFFVMENVVGLLDDGSRELLFEAISTVPKKYTILGPLVLNALDCGAPTKRKRVVVIGYDPAEVNPISVNQIANPCCSRPPTVRDAISDLPSPISDSGDASDFGWGMYAKTNKKVSAYAQSMREIPIGMGFEAAISRLKNGFVSGVKDTRHTTSVSERFQSVEPGDIDTISRYPRLAWEGFCPTLRAGTGSDRGSFQAMRPIHPSEPRVITVREAARLQGFPDWFVFHPSKWHSFRMIGNSVSPFVSKHLLTTISEKLKHESAVEHV